MDRLVWASSSSGATSISFFAASIASSSFSWCASAIASACRLSGSSGASFSAARYSATASSSLPSEKSSMPRSKCSSFDIWVLGYQACKPFDKPVLSAVHPATGSGRTAFLDERQSKGLRRTERIAHRAVGVDWLFEDDALEAFEAAAFDDMVFVVIEGGHQDHRQRRPFLLYRLVECVAVHVGHDHVAQDEVEGLPLRSEE